MKFSQIEKEHLLKSWVAISFAFAVLFSSILSSQFIIYFFISLMTVGIGFLLHELGHKFIAQKYGCWAEYRADNRMLIFAVLGALLFRFVFAAPGAVLIHGHVTRAKSGKISLAGPLTNIILAIIFLLGLLFLPVTGLLLTAFNYGFQINAFIALFNLIPVMPFDGAKVIKWNKTIFAITIVFAALLVFLPI